MDDEDLYATLGVDPSADAECVRRAYHKLAVRWHPDKNPGDSATAEVMFKKVAAAYEVLSDERKRAAYDGERAEQRAGTDPRGGARARGARAPGRGASRFGAERAATSMARGGGMHARAHLHAPPHVHRR